MTTQDAETEKQLSRSDLVKGYEFKKDTYVLLTDQDFESVRVESSSLMAIEKFVEADSIDPIYYDSSYYLAPDGKAGQDVYAVLREAIEETGRVALSRVVIGQRERTIALRPTDGGLVAQTLYEQRDINDAKPIFEDVANAKTDPAMVQLAKQLIDRQSGRYDPSDLEDRYEARLRAMIDAKLKGEGIEEEDTAKPDRGNVVDLMSALKKSLGQSADPAPAKASAQKAASGKAPVKKPAEARAQATKPTRKRA
jgi:DNA end-binding protein Ku